MAKLKVDIEVVKKHRIEPIYDVDGKLLFNGFVPVVIQGCDVASFKYEKQGSEFEGLDIKSLHIEFKQLPIIPNDPPRYLDYNQKIVGTKEYGDGGILVDRPKEAVDKNVQDMWASIVHIFNTPVTSPNHKAVTKIPAKDIDKFLDYPTTGTVAERVKGHNAFVEYLAAWFNNGDKPMWIGKDGKPIVFWLKVELEYSQGRSFTVPTWVGTGFIAIAKTDDKGQLQMTRELVPLEPHELIRREKTRKGGAANQAAPGSPAQPSSAPPAGTPTIAELLKRNQK